MQGFVNGLAKLLQHTPNVFVILNVWNELPKKLTNRRASCLEHAPHKRKTLRKHCGKLLLIAIST